MITKWILCQFCNRPSDSKDFTDDLFRYCIYCGALGCVDCQPISQTLKNELQCDPTKKYEIQTKTFICYGCRFHPYYIKRNGAVSYLFIYIVLYLELPVNLYMILYHT